MFPFLFLLKTEQLTKIFFSELEGKNASPN